MAPKPTKDELNYRAQRLAVLTPAITKVLCTAMYGVVLCWASRYVYLSVEALAGKATTADVLVRALTDLRADQWFAALFGAGGVCYGLGERFVRKRTVARMHGRQEELEKMLDPKRSTSGLPASGNTSRSDLP